MARRKLLGALWKTIEVVLELINDMALRLNTEGADSGRDQVLSSSVASSGLLAELVADHATMRTEVIAIGTTLADYKAIYDAHTHECPGSSFAASRCSTADTGAAENSLAASAASAFTDTSGSPPATLTATATGSEGRVGVGITDDGNAQDVQFDHAVWFMIAGQKYYKDVDAVIDISAECVAAGDTVAQNKSGAFWFMLQSDGTVDAESNQATQSFASAILALANYSIATNTLPIVDHCPCAVLSLTEGNSGAWTFGTDSIAGETEVYYSFEGIPGIESELASFALDAAAATITYGAVTLLLGTGSRVVATGKANVAFDDTTQVAVGKTGAYLLYVLADDSEALVVATSTANDLQAAKDVVRDLAPNPLMPLVGVIYVTARLNAFTPGTTNLDLNGIDTEFVTYGVTTNRQEHGRSSGSTFTPIDEVLHESTKVGQNRRP